MAEGLTKLAKKTHSKRLNDEAEIDSVDSLICTCGFYMRMRHQLSEKRSALRTLARLNPDDGDDD